MSMGINPFHPFNPTSKTYEVPKVKIEKNNPKLNTKLVIFIIRKIIEEGKFTTRVPPPRIPSQVHMNIEMGTRYEFEVSYDIATDEIVLVFEYKKYLALRLSELARYTKLRTDVEDCIRLFKIPTSILSD